ncbi:glycosyltransferase family 2 protein [Parabacteroides pacaensis]|uniref:glycosyltransferase family 2 protein n=1 Tax=Parabacteroides pacaensis TaxID=2086575 RepID=UPI000D0F112D|nr:glycosyltransferase family 2 protein [Parabacteroides pacaensis]
MEIQYPRFTVIIPQKDRAEYLYWTLKTCMLQDYPNFEVIVSDDCSEDNSVEVVEKLARQDSRIKLFAHKQHLGMRENFEFALRQVQPGYVMALGGDDGLLPSCIQKMYEIIKETGTQLLTWPHARFSYENEHSVGHNLVAFKRTKNSGYRKMKSSDFLKRLAKTFIYQIDECPMMYIKGIVSTELIDRVKSRTGDGYFYYCPTPDGFSGVVLAGEVEEYIYANESLSIGGSTTKSQGQNYRRTDAKSRAESVQFFEDNARKTMHAQLASQPYSPLETLMSADYLLTASDLPGWPGKCFEISFENLLIQSFKHIQNSFYHNEVLVRELNILKAIAKQHGLLDLFERLYKSTYKKVATYPNVYGYVHTHSIRFDGSELGIQNIYDASFVIPFLIKSYRKYSWKTKFQMRWRQFQVIKRQYFTQKESLPKI